MKKAITLLFAVVSTLLASFSLAAPPAALAEESRAAAIGQLMQTWQARIVAFGLPVDDAKNWSRRNMAKFSKLNPERLALAQRASTLDELELVLLEAPVPAGTHLDVLLANKPGDIAMMGARPVTKASPATSPSAYAGLVFTAVTTCRILDTRPSQGGFGAWSAGSSNLVKIGPYSTGYYVGPGAQGGSNTSCGLDALAGPGQVAAILAAVSTFAQTGPGYLTFFPNGAPNPGATSVSQWYQPGYVQTSFVLIPTDLVGTVAASGFTSKATEVIIDVVGYFAAEAAEGTVTSITAGTGLTGGTITTAGTIAIAPAYQLPQACTNGQVAQSNGASSWSCVTPAAACAPGDKVFCYTSPTGTPGVGPCQNGLRTCNAQGTGYGPCVGEVGPNCGTVCANFQTDPTNCGACGVTCSAGTSCTSGACVCGAGTVSCGGTCANLSTDRTNCGACGFTCSAGAICTSGACVCGPGTIRCGGTCANVSNDPRNCGACGLICAAGSACISGTCT